MTAATLCAQESNPLEGRWDLVMTKDGQEMPSWLEVKHSGNNTLVGRFVYAFGSARPIAEVKLDNENSVFPFRHNGSRKVRICNLKAA